MTLSVSVQYLTVEDFMYRGNPRHYFMLLFCKFLRAIMITVHLNYVLFVCKVRYSVTLLNVNITCNALIFGGADCMRG
jgi:hypothetical protein